MTEAEPLSIAVADFDIATHDATITLTSPKTGDHRTFRIRTERSGNLKGKRVVSLLTGPDNTSDFTGFGFVEPDGSISVWRKQRGEPGSPSLFERYADLLCRAAYWAAKGVTFEFALRCRRCGHLLTRPESISDGLGETCRSRMS